MNKICKKCGVEKDIGEFYVHKAMKDGYLSFCKLCVRSRVHNHYTENIEAMRAKERERSKRRYKDPAYVARHNKGCERYLQRAKLPRNIARKLKKQMPNNCEMCGVEKSANRRLNGHHTDYSKPFKVMWVCTVCHSKIHNKKLSLFPF